MADIRVIEENEVFWATTKDYTLVIDGETIECRIAENSKGVTFFEWGSQSGWEEADTDGGIMHIIYEAWCEGELSN
jgi:hypothetical protein